MEGHCKDCDFWAHKIPFEWSFGQMISDAQTGECSCKKFIPVGENHSDSVSDEFLMFDDMGMIVQFYPCAHFGCIHFKARP